MKFLSAKSAKRSCNPRTIVVSAILLLVLSLWAPAHAAIDIPNLSNRDRAAILKIEGYLNKLVRLKSRFLQASSNGQYSEGTFYLSRPGKMRIEYDPPVEFMIVADGTWLIYVDNELDQITHLPLGTTPADILVQDNISLVSGTELIVTKIERSSGVIGLTLIREGEEGGELTLIFADKPLELKKWIVVDAQGIKTSVSLLATERDISLDPELFHVKLKPQEIPLGEGK